MGYATVCWTANLGRLIGLFGVFMFVTQGARGKLTLLCRHKHQPPFLPAGLRRSVPGNELERINIAICLLRASIAIHSVLRKNM